MSTAQTQQTMDRYFELMGRSADFGTCYTSDVTWLIAEAGEVIQGADAVRDYVVALHATMVDARTRTYIVGDGFVYLEGDCAIRGSDESGRTNYCVAYELADDAIAAMRCYGLGARPAL